MITNFAVLPIAGSALFLTISHYRSWQMWLLYLVLAIIMWTTLNGIAFFILYDSERYWKYSPKSFGKTALSYFSL